MAVRVHWLYSSKGIPIAFLSDNNVYSATGKFLGCLDGKYVVGTEYVGELYEGNHFVRQRFRPLILRECSGDDFELPMSPPKPIEAIILPTDLQDIGPF